MIVKQLHIFFNALAFFTRIPSPKWVVFSKEYRQKSIAYFSFVGIIVGGFAALVFFGANYILPTSVAILLSMVGSIYLTGAFHEDGFADVCDGFGGGWNKEKILLIMKDSQIGAFGAIGLCLLLGLKFASLYEVQSEFIPIVLISGHAVSRFMAALLVYQLPYVSSSETSKSKDRASRMSDKALVVNIICGIAPLFFFESYFVFLCLIPPLLGMWFLASKFKKWIGGQTGDCAGATQQFCEVVFYMSLLVLWKFI
ncbi:MAG: adenosylcobinamide-GDP ribazoletransferase [Bacteroidota bacterium]